jgi:hypothetical protein
MSKYITSKYILYLNLFRIFNLFHVYVVNSFQIFYHKQIFLQICNKQILINSN